MQLQQLSAFSERIKNLENFNVKLKDTGLYPLTPTKLEIFQINIGKMCNQVCKHCHVDAGPDRKEIMTRETLEHILKILTVSTSHTVDITGGAPEMNPNFRWFVTELTKLNKKVIVRCNLTIILANKSYNDLPEFFKANKVHVVSSLPYYDSGKTDRQRGDGVFDKSIEALKMLNQVGYGIEGTGLKLDLVYNPSGAFLPGDQQQLERDFKQQLKRLFGIEFNQLFAITNMPISRFLEYLIESGNYEDYMEKLVQSYNPSAAAGVMCRNTISVGWDGKLFDCDFNQMLGLPVKSKEVKHLSDYSEEPLLNRTIATHQHCYGCTAGAGSSCGGTTA
ncbi:MAG: arsenosugar biosynthesis radical SAM (seleno)protein ArsS [Pseudobdellovibrio sp.]